MQNIEPTLLNDIHMPRWNELPNVDLYLDQVVTLINSCLNELISGNISEKKETYESAGEEFNGELGKEARSILKSYMYKKDNE